MRSADRRAVVLDIPSAGIRQQVTDARVNEPETCGQFPAVAVPLHAAREEHLHEMPVVLHQTPSGGFGVQDATGRGERLGDERGEPLDQDAADERDEYVGRVDVESPHGRPMCLEVEPRRWTHLVLEEMPKRPRRLAKRLVIPFDTGPDAALQLVTVEVGDVLDDRIEIRVADARVTHIDVRQCGIDVSSPGVPLPIGTWGLQRGHGTSNAMAS